MIRELTSIGTTIYVLISISYKKKSKHLVFRVNSAQTNPRIDQTPWFWPVTFGQVHHAMPLTLTRCQWSPSLRSAKVRHRNITPTLYIFLYMVLTKTNPNQKAFNLEFDSHRAELRRKSETPLSLSYVRYSLPCLYFHNSLPLLSLLCSTFHVYLRFFNYNSFSFAFCVYLCFFFW